MGRFKELMLVILVITTLIISCKKNIKDDSIVFKGDEYEISLIKADYKFINKGRYSEIKILNDTKLDSIEKIRNCTIFINKENEIAKGINIKSSIVPEKAKYFFSVDNEKLIIIRDEIIVLKLVHYGND